VILVNVVDLLRREPVRVYVYGVLAAVAALLLFYGVITAAALPVIMAVVVAALAVPSPVEAVRNRVTPVDKENV
jgi:hypothetical protein